MQSQRLTETEDQKVNNDLFLISLLTKLGKELELRVIIAGGYAVDAALGKISRYHNDIDAQVYGKSINPIETITTLLQKVAEQDSQFDNFVIEDKAQTEYYRNLYIKIGGTIADIYYLQTNKNPFESTKILIKQDGTITEPHEYDTNNVTLNGISFEAQDPLTEVVDKIYKREHRGDEKKDKHQQDIENLKEIVSSENIDKELKRHLG